MARRLGVAATTVRAWLKEAGARSRSISDAKAGQKPASHTVEASVRSRRKKRLRGKPAVGYKVNADGYVLLYRPDHPRARKDGYILEHRLVMEAKLGRPLLRREIPHHENGKRTDNRPGNLELKPSQSEHMREHYRDREIDPKTGRFIPTR